MDYVIDTIREFHTPNFTIIVDAIPEDDGDLSWDETGETMKQIESGELMLFCVRARVFLNGVGEVASDYLGQCIYKTPSDFQDHRQCGAETRKLRKQGSNATVGSYFSDMVHEVCRQARDHIATVKSIRVRGAA